MYKNTIAYVESPSQWFEVKAYLSILLPKYALDRRYLLSLLGSFYDHCNKNKIKDDTKSFDNWLLNELLTDNYRTLQFGLSPKLSKKQISKPLTKKVYQNLVNAVRNYLFGITVNF